jgi:hypothetical protein
MAALGVVNNQPPNSIKPRLGDRIHLRFAFAPERDLPWYFVCSAGPPMNQ